MLSSKKFSTCKQSKCTNILELRLNKFSHVLKSIQRINNTYVHINHVIWQIIPILANLPSYADNLSCQYSYCKHHLTFTSWQHDLIKVDASATCSTTSEAITASKLSSSVGTKSSTAAWMYLMFCASFWSCMICACAVFIFSSDASTPITNAPRRARG